MRGTHRKLERLMPPPDAPMDCDGDWDDVEEKLGLKLPNDYKQFISRYGTVLVCHFLNVFNPFSKNRHVNLLKSFVSRLRVEWEMRETHSDLEWSWDFYPAKGGVLSWGVTIDGDELFWRTKGRSGEWDVVVHDRGWSQWYHVEGQSFSDFLLALLTKQYEKFSIPAEFLENGPQCDPVTSGSA